MLAYPDIDYLFPAQIQETLSKEPPSQKLAQTSIKRSPSQTFLKLNLAHVCYEDATHTCKNILHQCSFFSQEYGAKLDSISMRKIQGLMVFQDSHNLLWQLMHLMPSSKNKQAQCIDE